MAGSYNHATATDGQLLNPHDFSIMIENLGDAYETIEEMYGMIWYLAGLIDPEPAAQVETAQQNYREGLTISPGTNGGLPDDN